MQARRKRKQRGRGLTPEEAAILKRRFKQVAQGYKKFQRAKRQYQRDMIPSFGLRGPIYMEMARRKP